MANAQTLYLQVLLVVLYVVAASSLAFQLPQVENELFFSICEWIVYISVVVSVYICCISVYHELQLKMVTVAAEDSLPSEMRSLHRTIVQWILKRTPSGLKIRSKSTLNATARARRTSVSNRGNLVEKSLVTIFRTDSLRQLVNSDTNRDRFLAALAEVSAHMHAHAQFHATFSTWQHAPTRTHPSTLPALALHIPHI